MDRQLYGNKETVTDIFFRVAFIKESLKKFGAYYYYNIQDNDTPESIANKVYGDPGAHWMILYANDMYDPQFDWPLSYDAFNSYIAQKYKERVATASVSRVAILDGGLGYSNGSIVFEGQTNPKVNAEAFITVDHVGQIIAATMRSNGSGYIITDEPFQANVEHLKNANLAYQKASLTVYMNEPSEQDVIAYTRTTAHHYEKVITRTSSFNGESTVTRILVNGDQLTNGTMIVANNSAIIDQVIARSIGSHYANGYIKFEGGHGSDANASIIVNQYGSIAKIVLNNPGKNYIPGDYIYANVQHLIVNTQLYQTATITVTIKNNGTGNQPIVGEYMEVNTDNKTVFSGNVYSYNASNGYLVLENTRGNFETSVFLVGSNSGANLEILTTSHGLYDYYNNLPANTSSISSAIDQYYFGETVSRVKVSIYDHELERNEHNRQIKIISPTYYTQIQSEFKDMLRTYNDYSSNSIYSSIRRLV